MRRGYAPLALIMLTACSTKDAPPATPAATAAQGKGDHTLTVTVGDKERTFQLHVPPGYDPARAMPAVVALHHRPGPRRRTTGRRPRCRW
ncbi:hypothetical protein ACQEVZ_19915 [Dactylosporangium sp. CA-152071]|uniref:hypothetical protein n=1 Tax=Dactylosporangium sp. CA-152071 TaxID=3239933 RepID=UPI003D91C9EE